MQPAVWYSEISTLTLTGGWSDNDLVSEVNTVVISLYHTSSQSFHLLFPFNYSLNESGATFIKLSGEKDIYEAAAQ